MTFLRVYLPLDRLPVRLHDVALKAAKRSRAEIETEAAERLNHRLRPATFSTGPSSAQPPIVRMLEATDYQGTTHQYFHFNYLARATLESASLRRSYFPDELYNHLVTTETLDTLEKVSEIQAEAGFVSRRVPTFNMDVWKVPVQWLTAFGGEPDEHETNTTTETTEGGTKVVRRVRSLYAAAARLGWVHQLLAFYGPEGRNSLYARQIAGLQRWFSSFETNQSYGALLELDYGSLTQYAWPDHVGQTLEDGHDILEQLLDIYHDLQDLPMDVFPGFPPAMLTQAADIMQRQYHVAVELMEGIARYEHAN